MLRIPKDFEGRSWEYTMGVYNIYGGFLSHGGTPVHHPFLFGMFLDKSHPAIGVPPYNVGDPMLRDFPIENGSVIEL